MEGLVPPPSQKQNHHTVARKIVSSASLTDLWLLVREGSLADMDLVLMQLKKNGRKLYMIMEISCVFDQTYKEHLDGMRLGGDKIYHVFDNQLPPALPSNRTCDSLDLDSGVGDTCST